MREKQSLGGSRRRSSPKEAPTATFATRSRSSSRPAPACPTRSAGSSSPTRNGPSVPGLNDQPVGRVARDAPLQVRHATGHRLRGGRRRHRHVDPAEHRVHRLCDPDRAIHWQAVHRRRGAGPDDRVAVLRRDLPPMPAQPAARSAGAGLLVAREVRFAQGRLGNAVAVYAGDGRHVRRLLHRHRRRGHRRSGHAGHRPAQTRRRSRGRGSGRSKLARRRRPPACSRATRSCR